MIIFILVYNYYRKAEHMLMKHNRDSLRTAWDLTVRLCSAGWVGVIMMNKYMEVYGAKMGENKRQIGSLAVVKCIFKEPSVLRNGLLLEI